MKLYSLDTSVFKGYTTFLREWRTTYFLIDLDDSEEYEVTEEKIQKSGTDREGK